MSDIARVVLTGRVGQDPEMKKINDTDLGTFSLAVDQYNGPKKEKTTGWWRCEVWGPMTKVLGYVSKGTALTVSGELRQDKVDEKTYHKVRVDGIRIAPGGGESDGERVKAKSKKKPEVDEEDVW